MQHMKNYSKHNRATYTSQELYEVGRLIIFISDEDQALLLLTGTKHLFYI